MQRNFGPIMQNAFVVPDLAAAIDHWVRVMNVGPFFMFEHIPFAELWYRGAPARVDLSCAIAYHGDLQIELIRQQDDAPSIYTDFAVRLVSGPDLDVRFVRVVRLSPPA